MQKRYLLCVLFLCSSSAAIAQSAPTYTADSLKSGNAKDVLASFFQIAANNIFGTGKEFRFTANPYDFYQKMDARISVDTNRVKWNFIRKFNVGFGLKLDSNYNYNGFTSGLKFAIINHTDPTTSRWYANQINEMALNKELISLSAALDEEAARQYPNPRTLSQEDFQKFRAYNNAISDYLEGRLIYDKITDSSFKAALDSIIAAGAYPNIARINADNTLSIKSDYKSTLEDYREKLKKGTLWTIGVSDTTYKDKFQFANVTLVSEFSKGVINVAPHKNNFELNGKALYTFSRDTLQADRNFQRQVFDVAANLNWVVRDKKSDQSCFEASIGTEYHYVAKGNYAAEHQSLFTLNGTLRVRVINDIWLPVELKYDPETGSLFGLLNVKFNFSALGNILNKQSSAAN